VQTTVVKSANIFVCLQLWIKAELAKKVDANSGAIAEIGERFIFYILYL